MSNLETLKEQPPYAPLWKVIQILNRVVRGHLNPVGTVTLTNGGVSTVLSDNQIKAGSKVFLFPQTAHAAGVAGLWADPLSIPVKGGQITLNHVAVAQADLNFSYLVVT